MIHIPTVSFWPVRRFDAWLFTCLMTMLLAACGGDSDDREPVAPPTVTAPTIATQPASTTVTAPATATFTVNATGSDLLAYQWQKNGTPIASATSASYTTPPTVDADAGTLYAVVVSNSAGSVTSVTATLTVNAIVLPVSITTQPTSQSVTPGGTATFSVTATGGGTVMYKWTRNGTPIEGADAATYVTPGAAAVDDGAMYAVVVSNAVGSATSDRATLRVTPQAVPVAITSQPMNATANPGQTATFSIAATGTVPIDYQWQRNGLPISGATGPSYTTPVLTLGDNSATFHVIVSNAVGPVMSSDAMLAVSDLTIAPTIVVQPGSLTVTSGQAAGFSVSAAGSGPLAYQWLKDATAIAGATSATYVISHTTLANNGAKFTVTVSNAAGQVTSAQAVLSIAGQTSPSRYVLSEASLNSMTRRYDTTFQTTLYVFDPTTNSVLQTIDLGTSATPRLIPAWKVSAFSVDRDARTQTYDGDSTVVYVKSGKVYKIDLSSSASHDPEQISSVTNACRTGQPLSLSADGSQAWLAVSVNNGSGCTDVGDGLSGVPSTSGTFVRTDMSSTTAPKVISGRLEVLDVLDDGAKNALGLFMRVDGRLFYYDDQLDRKMEIQGVSSQATLTRLAYDYGSLQAAYYKVDSGLQRLSWTASSAAFEPASYVYTDSGPAATDSDATYLVDGTKLLKVIGSAAPVAVAALPGAPLSLQSSAGYLSAQYSATATSPYGSSLIIKKSDGTSQSISSGFVVGVGQGRIVYSELGKDGKTHAVNLDGSNAIVLPYTLTPVFSRLQVAGQKALEGTIACLSDAAPSCWNGQIVQSDLLGNQIELGAVAHSTSNGQFSATPGFVAQADDVNAPFSGLPTLAWFRATLPGDINGGRPYVTDFYVLTPGIAASLKPLTRSIP